MLILSVGRSVPVGSFTDGGFSSDDRFLNGRIRWVGSPAGLPPLGREPEQRARRVLSFCRKEVSVTSEESGPGVAWVRVREVKRGRKRM